MRNEARWTHWLRGEDEGYCLDLGAHLHFSVVRRPASEARGLWTVSVNDFELDWTSGVDEAVARVEQEGREIAELWRDYLICPFSKQIASGAEVTARRPRRG